MDRSINRSIDRDVDDADRIRARAPWGGMKDDADASASAYAHVVRGKLKLKGVGGVDGKVTKTSSKTSKKKKSSKTSVRGDGGGRGGGEETSGDRRTAAEKADDAYKTKHEERLIAAMASASHKDKVAAFNEKLSKLSEHHDIPKVGPG